MTTLNPSSPADLATLQRQLLGRFEQFRRRVRTHLLLEGVARVLAEFVGLIVLSFVLDRLFRLGLTSRLTFTALGIAFIVWEFRQHILRPLRLPLDPVDLATAIDQQHAGVRSGSTNGSGNGKPRSPIAARVAAVLQLPDLLLHDRPPSEPMIRRAVHRSYESLQD